MRDKPFDPIAQGGAAPAERAVLQDDSLPRDALPPDDARARDGAPREVVGTYVQPTPLPGRSAPPPQEKRRKKRSHRGLWIFLICAAAAGGLAVGSHLTRPAPPPASSQEMPEEETVEGVSIPRYAPEEGVFLPVTETAGPALSPQEIYARLNPSVVTVMTQLDSGYSMGTGVLFTSDGYLLTNYHVVDGGTDCSVTLSDDTTYEALYVAGDSGSDLAVLKVNAAGLSPAQIGSSDALVVGDTVYAIGNPLGIELRGTFTDGIVSAVDREIDVDGRTMTLVQHNAALNSGNSGGPLINAAGQVVGINTIKMGGAFTNIEGLGFAIPSSSMRYLVDQLLQYGEVLPQARLGLSVSYTGRTLPDGTVGVTVMDVAADGSAERAGIKLGDVIVSADGEPVTSSTELLRQRRRFIPGDEMTLRVFRNGSYQDVTLVLDAAEEE